MPKSLLVVNQKEWKLNMKGILIFIVRTLGAILRLVHFRWSEFLIYAEAL